MLKAVVKKKNQLVLFLAVRLVFFRRTEQTLGNVSLAPHSIFSIFLRGLKDPWTETLRMFAGSYQVGECIYFATMVKKNRR